MNRKVDALAIEYPWEQTLLRVLLVSLGILTVSYLYFVAASVFNVIAHKEADLKSTRLETTIGKLEQEYFALSQQLTAETGASLGLSSITEQSYVYRPGNVGQAQTAPAQIAI